jgi:ABC-type nitrate/sulfonate/bicarbonate transport system substrate-binding protein
VLESFNAWAETLRFACEVQNAVSLRLLRMAQRGTQAAAEAQLMVAEKIEAFAVAEAAIAQALCDGEGFMVAAERGYAPLRQCVGANSSRLAHAMA